MKELELTPIEKVSDFVIKKKRFYAAPTYDKNQKKVFFKILIVEDSAPTESIKKEMKMRTLMLNFQDKITFPHLIKYNDKNIPYWFISEYLEGDILGFLYDLHNDSEAIITLLVATLSALHDISESNLHSILTNDFFLKKDGFDDPLTILKSFENKLNNDIKTSIDFPRISRFIKERENFFQNHKIILSHGDYTLNNMVISSGKMVLTDWESACLGNIASDIAHLWIQLWRYPKLRQKLLADYINNLPDDENEEFKKLFEAKVIFEALAELIWNIEICPEEYKKAQAKICIKTIETAFEGFDELLKL
jgi:thiamine kinase-like enzyme